MKTKVDLQNPNRHKTKIFLNRGLLVAVVVQAAMLAAAVPVYASSITWGAIHGISGDNDVSTNGSLVGAFNLGGPAVNSTVINGVNFTGLTVTGQSNVTSGNFNLNIAAGTFQSATITPAVPPYSTLSAAYREMLSTPAGDFTTPFTLTMSGLTAGLTYEFQWWSNSSGAFTSNTTATAGNAVVLNCNTTGLSGGLGQYVIGTFVADSAMQQIIFGSDFQSVLNGFQLRQLDGIGVPETGSMLVLLGGVLLGLAAAHRKTGSVRST